MKIIIIISVILLLSSCQEYRYDITYEKCSGLTGSVISEWHPVYSPRDRELFVGYQQNIMNNICDFSYTTTSLTK